MGLDESTPPRHVDREGAADLRVAALGHLPALALFGDVVTFQPHRLIPAERHVELSAVDLLERRTARVGPPACRTSAAQSAAPCGATGSRPGNCDGSERTADPRIHAGWRPAFAAASPPSCR